MLRIITQNVNSIRNKIDHLCSWLTNYNINIALLQECTTNDQLELTNKDIITRPFNLILIQYKPNISLTRQKKLLYVKKYTYSKVTYTTLHNNIANTPYIVLLYY